MSPIRWFRTWRAARYYCQAFAFYHATYALHVSDRQAKQQPPGMAPAFVIEAQNRMMERFDELYRLATGDSLPMNWADPDVIKKHRSR